MDVSGALLRWGSPTRIGAWLREQVAARFHITCSVGVACNKLVAKMASTNAKPNGMLLIPASQHAAFVQMMPLRAIPGIGPALERRLHTWGVESVRQLAALTPADLERITGSHAQAVHLYNTARGVDERSVVPVSPEKSIGSEHTFAHDVPSARETLSLLHHCCDTVASSLRTRGLLARTVTVKLRFPDLRYMTRSLTIEQPTDTASALYPVCEQLLRGMMGVAPGSAFRRLASPIRLAGMSVSGLSERERTVIQPTLDDLLEEESSPEHTTAAQRMRGAEQALDAVRGKFGKNSARLGL